ncbi:MBL fold metallo-hydrolase [Halapricum salinum]|uniref:MBL fold metallo-hydrolase n=1 Tax=Halapricum salinum TaxID=1457250 RepID=A0A4D6H931_9EURY|nr:MBL fold metallo-hydrolase [Halapricum salinum]QCC50433.1 MBL fold metallo-hydrolase [Halapricum salinum]
MRIERVDLDISSRAPGGGVAAYVCGDDDVILVDPGGDSDRLREVVAEAGVAHVLATHHHPDHVGGIAAYADEATVWARRGRESEFERASGVSPDRTFTPATTIQTSGGTVEIVDTPGHAPEHVALRVGESFVTGDLAVAEGSVVVGAPEGDMRTYLSSLRRLHARDPARLYPGHGTVIEAPRAVLGRLIAHRLDREDRVLAAVDAGTETLEAITDAAYEKDVSGVADLARATVAAHLEKLAVEGAIRWNGQRARPA